MNANSKITALYERLSIGDEQRGGGDSNSIKNQKLQLENYAKQNGFTNIRHYTDDDESGRFFDRSGYVQMMSDVESGKVGICVMNKNYSLKITQSKTALPTFGTIRTTTSRGGFLTVRDMCR